ncbi:type I restriction-modification system endonuclease [Lactobacillus johnsonii]|uniref:type I restriction-modification system endonuclease n=1 Tax=Lactobacillus TaxID=1578 RepID=UPI000B3F6B49|nr:MULTISPECIES: type I restriction-modification system endonuclease [Lactobacillus]ARW74920.1 type I restriction-modification system endonuclease [Lactobacillus johnsonii]ARW77119.1 type I restriction-modification system endonuclease [Lactobacillus johnsonii]PEG77906.1 type I restriction-modification system endonuclease [Lactobacillus sp. UMNPBX19]
MSNFQTTEEEYRQYAKLATSAESLIYSDPKSSVAVFGNFSEQLTREIMHLEGFGDWNLKQIDRINELKYRGDYPPIVTKYLDDIRHIRNLADHDHQFIVSKKQALEVDKKAYIIWNYFLEVYSQDEVKEYKTPIDQANIFQLQQEQIEQLKKELEEARKAQKPVEVSKELQAKRHKISVQFAKKHQLTEAETRQLIDRQLQQAGWEADSENLNNWKYKTAPQKGHNMAIAEWVLPNGQRADYALFKGLEFYGIVEAKKWDQDIAGQMAQPKEYSREVPFRSDYLLVDNDMGEYKVPFIYTANGRPYLKQYKEKSGIWFWDARNPKESAYALEEFHHPEDLALKLTSQNPELADQDLVDDQDFPKFADRDYQVEAIKSIEEAIKDGKKRILLAMATGTGKTRTAIALMYRLLKHKRARRILYLVDRNSLGQQTADAIKDNKIGNLSIASIYGVKELKDKLPDASTKIQIATVQGMIKRLFYNDDKEEKPSVGQYDFIIVDEAHRGYAEDKELSEKEYHFYDQNDYVSQYRRVVDYFDATAIGMTATPALQTTDIFGKPVYSYSYQQAVLDNYLVDHDAPTIIKTKLSQEGIHFKKGAEIDLFDQSSESIKSEKLPDNMNFEVKDFNKRVITESFNRVVCDYLAQNCLNPNDPELGKTLIFAATDSHADMVVRLLKESFKNAGNPVDDDAIEKITGSIRHPNNEIKLFKNEKNPNIAVTVDLLTTGVDVPEITNLVFLRRVQSRILYEQMLGRATRLCPEIHKSVFNIYDAVGIYDAMNKVTNMKPVVKNVSHDVHYFIDQKHQFEINDNFKQYQIDMTAAIDRKIKRMNDSKRKEFERLTEINSIDQWARDLPRLNNQEFLKEWKNFEQLDRLSTGSQKQYISNEPDEYLGIERGYGQGNSNPEDYIESFNKFIKENVNEIPALQIVATRPKDLTYDELKKIKLELEKKGFKENDLQTAWKNANQVQTTADIISFIRQAAVGSELVDHNVRIHNAMQKVYGMADWNMVQKSWLKKIENQLLSSTVLGPNAETAFSSNYFKRQGGYKQMRKIFSDNADQIIYVLNENLYV